MPALFKSFTQQAGLDYDVFLETRGGTGLDFHLENKLSVIGSRGWDIVVMHGYSTLDADKPRDPAKLDGHEQADGGLPPRAQSEGRPVPDGDVVARRPDLSARRAPGPASRSRRWRATSAPHTTRRPRASAVKGVIPVGEAWTRAMQTGVADPNPYDGIEPGKLNLWTYDHYHASTHGYYLEALVIFGSLTGRDPRSLGDNECSAYELGFARAEVKALQQVAFDQLANAGAVDAGSVGAAQAGQPATLRDGTLRSCV